MGLLSLHLFGAVPLLRLILIDPQLPLSSLSFLYTVIDDTGSSFILFFGQVEGFHQHFSNATSMRRGGNEDRGWTSSTMGVGVSTVFSAPMYTSYHNRGGVLLVRDDGRVDALSYDAAPEPQVTNRCFGMLVLLLGGGKGLSRQCRKEVFEFVSFLCFNNERASLDRVVACVHFGETWLAEA